MRMNHNVALGGSITLHWVAELIVFSRRAKAPKTEGWE
jgi:hypothetical protein